MWKRSEASRKKRQRHKLVCVAVDHIVFKDKGTSIATIIAGSVSKQSSPEALQGKTFGEIGGKPSGSTSDACTRIITFHNTPITAHMEPHGIFTHAPNLASYEIGSVRISQQ